MRALVPALALLAVAACRGERAPAPTAAHPDSAAGQSAPALTALRQSGTGPILSLEPDAWKDAAPMAVAMLPQAMATPMNLTPAVQEMTIRAAHNGEWLGLLITWQDSTRSDRVGLDHFGDQVAAQFPTGVPGSGAPSPTMGNAGGRVNILQWRAALQRDLEHGPPTIADLYPNASVDYYPDRVLPAHSARPYSGAVGLNNPVSRAARSPVLDQIAEGFGSLTAKAKGAADGRGGWADGQWTVVLTLPLTGDSAEAPRLSPGQKTVVAFAVWEGGKGEVGSRKAWSNWTPLVLGE